MALTASYTDLIADTDLQDASLDGVAVDLSDSTTAAALPGIISGVTTTIERHLDRLLIVRSHTLRLRRDDWFQQEGYENDSEVLLWMAYARQWPVVEVSSVDATVNLKAEITIQDADTDDRRLLSFDPDSDTLIDYPYRVDVFAGYARSDQTLATLQAVSGLTGIATLPPTLPDPIRDAAIMLCLHRINARRSSAGYGMRSMQQVGSGSMATVESVDKGFEARVLASIDSYRRIF